MKARTLLSLVIAAALPFHSHAAELQVTVVTENTPITQASDQHPEGGEATRFVEKLLQRAEIDYTLRIVPWRRGYQLAKHSKNTLIYPLARTREREPHFHWVGQLIPIRYYLFRLKARPSLTLKTLEDARPYTIGVVNYHAHHEYLLQRGFANLQPVNSSDQNLKKLLRHRIDFFPMSDGGVFPLCQRTQISCEQITPELYLEDIASGLYMAFGRDTDAVILQQTAETYQQLIADGTHSKVFAKRLNWLQQFEESW